jgi:hypothetical protein
MSHKLSLMQTLDRWLFGKSPSTANDAGEAVERARVAAAQCLVDIARREQLRPMTTYDLKQVCDDTLQAVKDAEMYLRLQRWGMAVAVAERAQELFDHFHLLMEQYWANAVASTLQRRYLETQGPIYPPRVTRFQRWMREHLLPYTDPRCRRYALR